MVTRRSRPKSNFYVLIGQIGQVSSCGKFLQHLETFFTLTAEAYIVLSTCDVFNCLFPLDVQIEIQLLSRFFCYLWLVRLLGFWLRNTSLVKVGSGIVFVSFT